MAEHFLLTGLVWRRCEFAVMDIEDIAWSSSLFDQLYIQPEYKELIMASRMARLGIVEGPRFDNLRIFATVRSYGIEPNHPYALTLKEQLLSAELDASLLGGDGLVDIDVEGQPGDLVNSPPGRFFGEDEEEMYVSSLPPMVWKRQKQSRDTQLGIDAKTHDWIIVLGGTKYVPYLHPLFLVSSFSADQIYTGLKATWSLALSSSPTTKLLALTVPECAYKSAKTDGNRDKLNKFILEHVEERLSIYAFDLKPAIPYHDMDEQRREEIWDDGLHFTDKGYDLMGEVISERLLELLTKPSST
ncbi:hypothetical protein ZTR_07110 [Talaromyces verruculosus]|nr:hypothetical protein ZTR_07110 [Talaromyces verruculosus]